MTDSARGVSRENRVMRTPFCSEARMSTDEPVISFKLPPLYVIAPIALGGQMLSMNVDRTG